MSRPASARKGEIVAWIAIGCWVITGLFGVREYALLQRRVRAAEARAHLMDMFTGAASYYEEPDGSENGDTPTHCAVGSARTDNHPGPDRSSVGPLPEAFEAIGFVIDQPVYYRYEIVGVGGCDHRPGEVLYSFRAHGDLDGDGTTSLYELAAGVGADGELVRSPTIYVVLDGE